MNKGQSKIYLFLGMILIVTAGLLFIVVSRGGPTGEVVLEVERENYIDEPFELRAWVASASGVQLDVSNVGPEDLVIREFNVEGCGDVDRLGLLSGGGSIVYSFDCSLAGGSEFSGEIRLSYSVGGSEEVLVSEGFVRDFV